MNAPCSTRPFGTVLVMACTNGSCRVGNVIHSSLKRCVCVCCIPVAFTLGLHELTTLVFHRQPRAAHSMAYRGNCFHVKIMFMFGIWRIIMSKLLRCDYYFAKMPAADMRKRTIFCAGVSARVHICTVVCAVPLRYAENRKSSEHAVHKRILIDLLSSDAWEYFKK